MKNERSQKRRHLIYYLSVYDRTTDRPIGRVVDITTEGLKLCSEEPIEVDKTYQLRMTLPKYTGGDVQVDFDAQALWSSQDVNPDLYDIGLKVLNAGAEFRETITRLIEEHSFPDTSTVELR